MENNDDHENNEIDDNFTPDVDDDDIDDDDNDEDNDDQEHMMFNVVLPGHVVALRTPAEVRVFLPCSCL